MKMNKAIIGISSLTLLGIGGFTGYKLHEWAVSKVLYGMADCKPECVDSIQEALDAYNKSKKEKR